jgi:sigma-B regulation protein RsbU (phosphoserine phosphatase)
MAHLQASLRTLAASGKTDVSSICAEVNRLFYAATPIEQYATAFFGAYDDAKRELCYVNAGHVPPLLLRNDGEIERLESTATVLGMFGHWDCDARVMKLQAGEMVVAFSDGLEEVDDALITATAAKMKIAPPAEAAEAIAHLATRTRQHDDVTVLVLRAT